MVAPPPSGLKRIFQASGQRERQTDREREREIDREREVVSERALVKKTHTGDG